MSEFFRDKDRHSPAKHSKMMEDINDKRLKANIDPGLIAQWKSMSDGQDLSSNVLFRESMKGKYSKT